MPAVAGGPAGRAARRRAVRGQEPLRRRRPADAGRIADQPRAAAGDGATRCWSRRMAAAGAVLLGSAQHGRIRLRLHRRERPRRRLPQPARPGPDERRLVVGLRRGDRRRAGSGLARLGHQRLAPGARLALRRLQPQADLRPAARGPAPSPSSTASTISGRWRARRATSRSPTTCCRGHDPADHACAPRPAEPVAPRLERGAAPCASGVLGGWFHENAGEEARAAVARAAEALGARTPRSTRCGWTRPRRAARPPISSPTAESADFHLRPAAAARRRFRPRHPRPLPRRRAAARRLGRAGAAGPALVARAGARRLPALSTFCWRRRRPARPRRAGEKTLALGGRRLPLRPSLGLLAQPFSCIGLPVATVPVFGATRCRSACNSSPARGASMSACRRRTCLEQAGQPSPAHPSHYPVLAMPRYMPDHPAGPGQVPWLG